MSATIMVPWCRSQPRDGHRYWRVRNFQSPAASVIMRELQLRERPNVSQPFTGSASYTGTNYGSTLSDLFSSGSTTFKAQASTGAYIDFDFGRRVDIQEVMNRQSGTAGPDGWDLYYSDDGSSWTLHSKTRGIATGVDGEWRGSETESGFSRGSLSFPTSTVKSTINDWDFVYTDWLRLRPEDSGWVFRVGLNLSKTFSNGGNHVGVIGDAAWTGQGAHCGPVIRRGEDLWSAARGWLIWNDKDFQAEEWLDTSPYLALGTKESGNQGKAFPGNGKVSVTLAGKYGHAGGSGDDTLAVAIYNSMTLGGGDLLYVGGGATNRRYPKPDYVRFGVFVIGPNFDSPNNNGCVEPQGPGTAPNAEISIGSYDVTFT